jgi:hypothetical protein
MNAQTYARYRHWREHGIPASAALSYARYEASMTAMLARFGEWTFQRGAYGSFARADMVGLPVRVLVGDDDHPTDWGDVEPTDAERAASSSYYVAVQVLGDDIGGVDVIDLPGYLQRDWEDAAAYALLEYLLDGAEKFARREPVERAYWEARDVVTVSD